MLRRAALRFSFSALVGCCVVAHAQPPIEDVEGASAVQVLRGDKGDQAPVCPLVKRVEVADGRFAVDDSAYRATVDRVERKLRNVAVEHEANVAFVLDLERPLLVDSPGVRGQRILASANLYRCDP